MSSLPLPLFYRETLTTLLPVFDDTLSSSSAQPIVSSSLDNLYLIQRMINSLALFSGNELASELGENELVFMSVGWVVGACEERGGLGSSRDRMEALDRAQNAYNAFIELLDTYQVVSPQVTSHGNGDDQSSMAARRREAKIRQYKYERDLRERIASLLGNQAESSSSTLTFILPLLQSSSTSSSTPASPEEEDQSRTIVLEVLRLLHTLATSSLTSIEQELELLASAPSPPVSHPSTSSRGDGGAESEDTSWRLDQTPAALTKPSGLISKGGKVLRPFTILPNSTQTSDRERLHNQVFSEGWRLPTMTIDEYLAEEQRRGNIITGGGQASYDAPTQTELLELGAEEDGTLLGDDNAEQLRQKDEKWAVFTETNKKGAGNTMNKG